MKKLEIRETSWKLRGCTCKFIHISASTIYPHIDSINASTSREGPTERNSHNRSRSRGRSPTRKPVTSNKQRAQSSSTRGRRGANSARRSNARSLSRNAQSKVPLCVDQAAGANNFKKPNLIDQNNAESEKKSSGPDPKQTDPKQTDRIPPNKSE